MAPRPVEVRALAAAPATAPLPAGPAPAGDDGDGRVSALEARLAQLEDFLATTTIGLHWVGPDGTILWANEADYMPLGYAREEYLGRHIAEFHADAVVIEDILARLARGERLLNYPARLKAKDGTVRHVLIDSSVRFEDGRFQHTRCFTRDVTALVEAQAAERRSLELLRAVVESASDAIFVKDRAGRTLLANEAAARALGRPAGEVVGRTDAELLQPGAAARQRDDDLAVVAEDRPRTVEEEFVVGGERRVFSTTKAPFRAADGAVLGVVGVARDITDRRRAEEAALLSQERYRRLVEASPLAVQVFAPDGACLFANEAWERLWGVPRAHLADYNILRDAQLEAKGVAPYVRRAFAGETVHVPPVRYDPAEVGKPGEPRWVEAYLYTVAAGAGRVREVVLILENVTSRVQAEADLRAVNARLRDLDLLKTQLINTASHELRTPLTPIALQLALLQSADFGPLNERQRKAVQVLDRNTQRLNLLVQDMLDVARLQGGRLVVQRDPMDLAPVLREAHESFQEAARRADVALDLALEGDLTLEADGQRVSQVLYNLLANALKFTPAGGRVAVAARRAGSEVVVEVCDTGVGLAQDQIARLFQPFSQVHDPTQRTRGGTGLGLYISRGIVEQHGGRIWAASDGPGKGAAFAFALPAPAPGA